MMLFDLKPLGTDGKPVFPELSAFPDHLERWVVHYLPEALELLTAADGTPDLFLLRYHGDQAEATGGLLRFRLGFSPLSPGSRQVAAGTGLQLCQVGFEVARFRLRLRSLHEGQPDQLGDWRSLQAAAHELVAPAVSLTVHETEFMEALLADGRNVVEVELELRYAGLVPGLPWLVRAETITLRTLLAALLPADLVRADQITAAFLSLPESNGPLSWRALETGVAQPIRDTVLGEVAMRSLGELFERQTEPDDNDFATALYRLRPTAPSDPATFSWDLSPPRQESRTCALNWSVASLVQSLDTPEKRHKLFPIASQVSPFAEVNIHVINHLPYDPHFLRKAVVDLRYNGAAGVPEFRSVTFDGAAEVQTFSAFYPAAAVDFQLAYRITTILAPPGGTGWPIIHKGDYAPASSLVVEVNRAAVGMVFIRVEAELAVFDRAVSIDVVLLDADPSATAPGTPGVPPLAQLNLTTSLPATWVALPGLDPQSDIFVWAVAHGPGSPEPPPYILRRDRVSNYQVRIAAYQLEVLDPDRITLQLDPQVANRFAMVRVTLSSLTGNERTYTLQPGQPAEWNLFRDSVFEQVRYRYRLDYVALDMQDHTLPMTSTDWTETQATTLVINPPLPEQEVQP